MPINTKLHESISILTDTYNVRMDGYRPSYMYNQYKLSSDRTKNLYNWSSAKLEVYGLMCRHTNLVQTKQDRNKIQ